MLTDSTRGSNRIIGKAEAAKIWGQQETLLAQARDLRARFGSPAQRLAEFLADMPPEDDAFWVEVLEAS